MTIATAGNRCFLLTPAGVGAIAVIRVAGPDAATVVAKLFRPASRSDGEAPAVGRPQRLHHGEIVVDGETVDDVLVCASPRPDGEPQVDINAHGGVRVVERLLMALNDAGVSVGTAEQAGRVAWPAANEIEAEAFAAASHASTRRAVKFILHQRLELPAYLERLADLASTDAEAVRTALTELVERSERCRVLVEGATLAILGPRNAGKSTLANRLLGADRAIVSDLPGTTRDWVAEPAAIRGIPVTVVDTPGVGTPGDALEEQAIARGMGRWADADLQLVVLDGGCELPDGFFEQVRHGLRRDRLLVVANKSDLPRRWSDADLPDDPGQMCLAVSALIGDGVSTLEEKIAARVGPGDGEEMLPNLFTRRQQDLVMAIVQSENLSADALCSRLRSEVIQGR